MFIDNIITFLKKWYSNTVISLHLDVIEDEIISIKYIIVKKNKSKIEILDTGNLDKLSAIPKKYPVIVTITSESLILLTSKQGEEFNIEEEIPVSNRNEIIVDKYPYENGMDYIVYRKQWINKIIAKISFLPMFKIYIGPSPLRLLQLFDDISYKQLRLPLYTLQINNGELEISRNEKIEKDFTTKLESLKINTSYILPYFSALYFWIYDTTAINKNINENEYSNGIDYIIKKTGVYFVILLFILLIINTVIFSYLYKENIHLNEVKNNYSLKIKRLEDLKGNIEEQQQFLQAHDLILKQPIVYYINEILKQTPASINLKSFTINPLIKNKFKENENIKFRKNVIIIEGEDNDQVNVMNWMDKIKQINHVTAVDLMEYEYDKHKKHILFKLKIQID